MGETVGIWPRDQTKTQNLENGINGKTANSNMAYYLYVEPQSNHM